jgi:hypothetical protein
MADRALSFYMKGLAIDVRQLLFFRFKNDISDIMIKHFLEKEDGYPSFRSMGFTDDDIRLVGESYARKFAHFNEIMIENGRPPLFSDPNDSYTSAQEYQRIWKQRSAGELESMFGCTFVDYVPQTLDPGL